MTSVAPGGVGVIESLIELKLELPSQDRNNGAVRPQGQFEGGLVFLCLVWSLSEPARAGPSDRLARGFNYHVSIMRRTTQLAARRTSVSIGCFGYRMNLQCRLYGSVGLHDP